MKLKSERAQLLIKGAIALCFFTMTLGEPETEAQTLPRQTAPVDAGSEYAALFGLDAGVAAYDPALKVL